MAEFVIRAASPHPATETFAHLVDWDAHSAAIPLTRLSHSGAPRVGQEFVARTGWRRLGFDDPMRVELFRPPGGDRPGDLPGVVEVAKSGRVIAGRVCWTITPGTTGAAVEWRQVLTVPWLPHWFDPVVGVVGRLAYRAGLGGLLR